MNATQTTATMTWDTFKGHGFETGQKFTYGGQDRKAPAAGRTAYIERTSPGWLTLVDVGASSGRGFGPATRFWAV